MTVTIQQLINEFLTGSKEGRTGTRTQPGNLSIVGNQLIHYQTPIAERCGEGIIVNITRYSIQTGNVQKQLKESLQDVEYISVKGVPRDFKGTLAEVVKKG